MAKITGRAFVRLGGTLLETKSGGTLNPGGFERTPHNGDSGYLGHSEKPVNSELELTMAHLPTSSLKAIANGEPAEITFETDNGAVFTIREAVCQNPPVLNAGEGEYSVTFFGHPAEEQTGGASG